MTTRQWIIASLVVANLLSSFASAQQCVPADRTQCKQSAGSAATEALAQCKGPQYADSKARRTCVITVLGPLVGSWLDCHLGNPPGCSFASGTVYTRCCPGPAASCCVSSGTCNADGSCEPACTPQNCQEDGNPCNGVTACDSQSNRCVTSQPVECAGGECRNGQCMCPLGQQACQGACVALGTCPCSIDGDCGVVGQTCVPESGTCACGFGQTVCNGACVAAGCLDDGDSCNGPEYFDDQTCSCKSGPPSSDPSCACPFTGDTRCGGTCTNTDSDPNNCGGCAGSGGSICGSGELCSNRDCVGDPLPPDPPAPQGTSWGDPHLVTFDGLAYDFQAVGEFVLVRSLDDSLQVQIRTKPWLSSRDISVMSAAAVAVGADRVMVDADGAFPVQLNGSPLTVTGTTNLGSGGFVYFNPASGIVAVGWPDGSQVRINRWTGDFPTYLDVKLGLMPSRAGRVAGLLGDRDGDYGDDLTSSADVLFVSPLTREQLYDQFGESWRISQAASLFDYLSGETTETFTDRTFPDRLVTVASLPDAVRQHAETRCADAGITDPIILAACVIDVGSTESSVFVAGSSTAPAPSAGVELWNGITGTWSAVCIASGGASYPQTWTITQTGTSFSGTISPSGVFTGSIVGDQFTMNASCCSGYTSTTTGTVSPDGHSIEATFIDSNGASGTCAAARQPIINGSFEDSSVDPGYYVSLLQGDNAIEGWTVGSGGIDYVRLQIVASHGSRSIDLNICDSGSIGQTLATQPGRTYELRFDFAGNPDADQGIKTLRVTTGTTVMDFQFDTTGRTGSNPGWEARSLLFTASAEATPLLFESLSPTCAGPMIDNVRIIAQ